MARYGARTLPNGKLTLAYDPAIAHNFAAVDKDVDFWAVYDCITCPTLVLRGAQSDLLSTDIANQMTQRGPKARLIEIADAGHAPSLMTAQQIKDVTDFLQ